MTGQSNQRSWVRQVKAIVLVLSLAFVPAFADEQVVTFIETGGRLIELTNYLLWGSGIKGAMMAIDAKDMATKENYNRLDNSDVVVRPWVRDGDFIVIHYLESDTQRRFDGSDVKTILLDRPWISDGCDRSCAEPDPA